ncbi:ABC transporter ATP-binding protein [Hamadaea tsunoensis]|uniref:ABC transporter ATP-binding protein n=1 Tax=Hamadaea tsunoensis TaxID=53368 RepID=UPI0003FD02F0|nr:ABC transporter ATP-binding protein [Hamadaea tsunoensis]
MTPAIEAIDVRRAYQLEGLEVQALRGVSFTIEPGAHVAVVGPSGSGKSTLMHLIGGLDRPTGGRLLIDGRDVAGLGPAELATLRNETIGFVFQSFHLLARTSAVDNVALPLVYRGLGAKARREKARAVLERVGLGHRLDHRPNQLSGGEQQRVAIARALVTDPAVLLADEPTGNLDTANGQAVLELLEQLNREAGVALVMVTHDREVAARARRRIHMRDGVIEQDESDAPETGDEIWERP